MNFFGWLVVLIGVVYLIKPDIFRRGIWTKTSIAQRTLSPRGYFRYMRVVGVVCILIGLYWVYGGHRGP